MVIRPPAHGFHFHDAPMLAFVMAIAMLIAAAALVSSIIPWS